jgi:hypothetical protein
LPDAPDQAGKYAFSRDQDDHNCNHKVSCHGQNISQRQVLPSQKTSLKMHFAYDALCSQWDLLSYFQYVRIDTTMSHTRHLSLTHAYTK